MVLQFSVKEKCDSDFRDGFLISAELLPKTDGGYHAPELARALIKQGIPSEAGAQYYIDGDGACMVEFKVCDIVKQDIGEKIEYYQGRLTAAITEAMKIDLIMKAIQNAKKE